MSEPHKCRLLSLSLASNRLTHLPDWLYYNARYTLERLDLSSNQNPLLAAHEGLCNLDRLKVIYLHGNMIRELPRDIGRVVAKIEEFGLEWWQYLYIDEVTMAKKDDMLVYRDDTIVTNRQIIRQIAETVRQLNTTTAAAGGKRVVEFAEFFRQYKRLYTQNPKERERVLRVQTLFQLVCHFGHCHLMDSMLDNKN